MTTLSISSYEKMNELERAFFLKGHPLSREDASRLLDIPVDAQTLAEIIYPYKPPRKYAALIERINKNLRQMVVAR